MGCNHGKQATPVEVIPGSVAQKEGFWTKNKADALQAGETSDRDGWGISPGHDFLLHHRRSETSGLSVDWMLFGLWYTLWLHHGRYCRKELSVSGGSGPSREDRFQDAKTRQGLLRSHSSGQTVQDSRQRARRLDANWTGG
eukprot:symbB.v1.2.003863.t1/scaffold211.1/size373615/4